MITVTPAAARQIRISASEGNMKDLPMRVAARRDPDGSIRYGMGFDDNELEGDIHVNADGIALVIAESSRMLVEGMTIDFVEIEPGSFQFIFLNPNDAGYVPPERS